VLVAAHSLAFFFGQMPSLPPFLLPTVASAFSVRRSYTLTEETGNVFFPIFLSSKSLESFPPPLFQVAPPVSLPVSRIDIIG